MGTDRHSVTAAALKAVDEKRDASRKAKRLRMAQRRPWNALEVEWHEQMKRTFGKKYVSSSWKAHEPKLARALLDEVDLEMAFKMIRRFIVGWSGPGTPSFGYFWKDRDSVRAMELGQVKTRRQRLDTDEYNEARDGKHPVLGW